MTVSWALMRCRFALTLRSHTTHLEEACRQQVNYGRRLLRLYDEGQRYFDIEAEPQRTEVLNTLDTMKKVVRNLEECRR